MKGQTTSTSKVWNGEQNRKATQLLAGLGLLLIAMGTLALSSKAQAGNFQQAQAKSLQGQIVERVSAHQGNKDIHQVVELETYRGRRIQTHELKTRANDLRELMQKAQIETRQGEIYYPAEIENALVKGEGIEFEKLGRAPINDDGGFGR